MRMRVYISRDSLALPRGECGSCLGDGNSSASLSVLLKLEQFGSGGLNRYGITRKVQWIPSAMWLEWNPEMTEISERPIDG